MHRISHYTYKYSNAIQNIALNHKILQQLTILIQNNKYSIYNTKQKSVIT